MREAHISEFETKRSGFAGCRECGRVFTGTEAFDIHRVGEHGVNRSCVTDPLTVGLRLDEKGRWLKDRGNRGGN